jgi:hypothetical protein
MSYRLEIAESGLHSGHEFPLCVELADDGQKATIDTGPACFDVRAGGNFPFAGVEVEGTAAIEPRDSGLFAHDDRDRPYRVRLRHIALLESGPVRTMLRLSGHLVSAQERELVEVLAFLHFFAGSSTVRCDLAVTNPRAAGHPGGRWSLGDKGSIYLRDVAFRLALPPSDEAVTIRSSLEVGAPFEECNLPLELYQDSSGGENWCSPTHVNRHGKVPHAFRGYRFRAGGQEQLGLRATPIVALESSGRCVAIAMQHFWQNFPKAIEASADNVVLHLFPGQYGDLHELQGGERKTHRFHIAFGPDEVSDPPFAWCREPLLVHAEPEWYAEAQAMPCLVPQTEDPHSEYQALVNSAIDGENTFEAKRELVDEYGWRHFGELYADHEAVHHEGPEPLVSHYNNQYDAVAGFGIHFLRSADGRWFRLMDDLARHVGDIDVYHTDRDKSTYNHGQFWHTVHYIDAGTSTHRSYPPVPGVGGGGPSAGNLYTNGLVLHHLLTGDFLSRETVLELGDYVIDADDGSKTVFRFLDLGFTGHVSQSAFDDYHGPGRSGANAIDALLDAHRLTGHDRYLEKAEELVRRSIHPADDLDARNLQDVENRWFYTMFLATLGKYLDHKVLVGQNDAMYAYARAALLHYATWAEENEYPYLDKPEILEHRTETWAAQDMRKSEVFRIAEKYANSEWRERFKERARFFFDASVIQLNPMPTRSLTRPISLLLSLGYGQAYSERYSEKSAPEATSSWKGFRLPQVFVSQKRRAKRKLLRLVVGSTILVVGLAAFGLWLTK